MIKLIAPYNIENIQNTSIKELRGFLILSDIIFIDTETKRKNLTKLKNDVLDTEVVMLQLGNKDVQYVIDLRETELPDDIKRLLSDKHKLYIGHNIKYDYQVLKNDKGIELEHVYDTMLGEYVLTTGLSKPKGYYSLEQTHYRYTNYNPYGEQLELFRPYTPKKTRTNVGGSGNFTYEEIHYGAMDIEATCRVFIRQIAELISNDLMRIAQIENRFALVLGDMELNGMPIDIDRWIELEDWAKEQMQQQLDLLNKELPNEVENWNSPAQVEKAFSKLGIKTTTKDIAKSKKLGASITKRSVQELVIKDQADKFPIINTYLKYKGFKKLVGTYGVKFLKHVNPITNRIHSSFFQILDTGRTSSSDPNMQNVVSEKDTFREGKWWREAFKASEGRTLIVCDYSSQEVHVLADQAQEHAMLEALASKADMHSLSASRMYNKPVSKKENSELRAHGKALNFIIPYGGGVDKIAMQFKIPKHQAQKLWDAYFNGFPHLKEHFEYKVQETFRNKYILIDKFGRKSYSDDFEEIEKLTKLRDYFPENDDIKKRLKSLIEELKRKSQNYPIQGASATMSKLAGIYLKRRLKGTSAKILLLIHDEWVVECDQKEAQKVKGIVEQCMLRAAIVVCSSIQIPADAIITPCWNK